MTFKQKVNIDELTIVARGRSSVVFAFKEGLVIKVFNKSCALDHVECEANIVQLLKNKGLPVPQVFHIVEVGQRWGIIYEKIDGVSLLDRFLNNLSMVEENSHLMADLHHDVHKITASTLPCLKSRLVYRIIKSQTLPLPQKKQILPILDSLPAGNQLCHMDFHPDQIMITDKGPYLLDWESACKGSPIADVARTSILIQVGQITVPSHISKKELSIIRNSIRAAYLSRYLGKVAKDVAHEIDKWEVILAADRLAEGIDGEEPMLRLIVDNKLNGYCKKG